MSICKREITRLSRFKLFAADTITGRKTLCPWLRRPNAPAVCALRVIGQCASKNTENNAFNSLK